MQHQQIAGEAAQIHYAPRETFSINGTVRKVASSTDSIVSGQERVTGIKQINIQTSPSIQLQGNPIREPKVEKKGGKTPVRGKPQVQILLLSQTRTRVKTCSADSQVRAPRRFQLIGIQNRTMEEIHILEIFPRTLMEQTLQPQQNTGFGRKIRYPKIWKLVK
ncbi:MAG: hypothetical protein EZS28_031383 [Streblomastix strix]|uniref:Uncharacterized protein n=1 Tax=Streblomastix strix TaxID=222440 RepID=A0A5J4URK4_9EUKA|nr:MAG: hypothetical protein EZS28_031383 [Streblomastix strix]